MSEVKRIARIAPNTLYREVQGETVLLHLDSGEYFGLDDVGTRMWQLIVEKGDLAEVEAALVEEFDADPAQLSQDLRQLVDDLVARRLIEVEQPVP
jgi:hypothetical protein